MTKREIRSHILAERRRIPPLMLEQRSGIIRKKLMKEPVWKNAGSIFCYVSLADEVATIPLIQAAWAEGKKVAVPRCEGRDMVFITLTSFDCLAPGIHGIPEPVGGTTEENDAALIIMPGVAFDVNRHRVGYGGGFYDRYLEAHPDNPTAAVAFDFSVLTEVPSGPDDKRPDLIVTDRRIIR